MALPKLPPVVPPTTSTSPGGSSSADFFGSSAGMSSPTLSSGPEGLLQRGLQRFGTSVDLGGVVGSSKPPPQGNVRGRSPEARRRRFTSRSEDSEHIHDEHLGADETNLGGSGYDDEYDGAGRKVEHAKEEEEIGVTDAEGWVYGDNKWEGASGKGGIGKVYSSYPRFPLT